MREFKILFLKRRNLLGAVVAVRRPGFGTAYSTMPTCCGLDAYKLTHNLGYGKL